MAAAEISAPAQTGDLGFAIADFIDGREFELFDYSRKRPSGRDEFGKIVAVDKTDPSNLRVHLDNGQVMTVRIISGDRP